MPLCRTGPTVTDKKEDSAAVSVSRSPLNTTHWEKILPGKESLCFFTIFPKAFFSGYCQKKGA